MDPILSSNRDLPILAGENPPFSETSSPRSDLLSSLLNEQQNLTAVEQFARHSDSSSSLASHYSDLLPATGPGPGEQYAFEVDLDACSGCKACVTGCHALNGLDDDEAWRDVGALQGGTQEVPVLQHVTSACHHCLSPSCMIACPVDAYEKDPVTGIVRHLDDQCFGCQYCTLACPYDVPKYNSSKGIVRKCDMCSDRIGAGEAPACVQSCPNGAISIQVVPIEQVLENSETDLFLPGAPSPETTIPTTSYKTSRVLPRNLLPVDYYSVTPGHAHLPLVCMLVLTQLSVGAFGVWLFVDRAGSPAVQALHSCSALSFGLIALAASVLHLGRPQYAFRGLIGLKHSWLSREILAFGVFAILATIYAWTSYQSQEAGVFLPSRILGWLVVLTGLGGVGCSVMIYHFTRRPLWHGGYTCFRFLMTTGILGVAAAWVTLLVAVALGSRQAAWLVKESGPELCCFLILASFSKLAFESMLFRHLWARRNTPLHRSARLLVGDLSGAALARFSCGLLGGIVMPSFLLFNDTLSSMADQSITYLTCLIGLLFLACIVGELLERYLFFTAVVSPKMPGGM